MKKFFKRAAAGLVAVGFATVTFTANVQTAHAGFGLGNVAGLVTGALGLNVNNPQQAHDKMIENFNYSISLLDTAYKNILTATDDSIANKDIIATNQVAKSALKAGDAGTNMKNGAEDDKQRAAKAKQYLADALASGDEEKLKKIDEFVKTANNQRSTSDFMAGVASTQAGIIIASSARNIASGNLSGLGDIITVAKEVQAALKLRSDRSKLLSEATKEYRKTRGIKDPSKKEQQAAADSITKE